MGKDFTFPLSRRLLEAIDIVTQQRSVHPNGTGELCHVDFLMSKLNSGDRGLHGYLRKGKP